jgi:hypothetical protein
MLKSQANSELARDGTDCGSGQCCCDGGRRVRSWFRRGRVRETSTNDRCEVGPSITDALMDNLKQCLGPSDEIRGS